MNSQSTAQSSLIFKSDALNKRMGVISRSMTGRTFIPPQRVRTLMSKEADDSLASFSTAHRHNRKKHEGLLSLLGGYIQTKSCHKGITYNDFAKEAIIF